MKVLNLYAGIGGNRKLWENVKITAVENNKEIAKIYQDFFPEDKMIITDAHQFLLEHFKEFDFIWSSPPCPSHSKLGRLRALSDSQITGAYKYKTQYPDMNLYQEIILLDNFFNGLYCIENVISYYNPLIKPKIIQRHMLWTNFYILDINIDSDNIEDGTKKEWENNLGFDLSKFKIKHRKDTILRNCVNPELGKHILECARAKMENRKIECEQQDLFL